MLRKSYDTCIVGQNYISLIYGLISLGRGKNTIVIEESEKSFASKWCHNIGYLERSVLMKLGDKYGIEVLQNIDNYLIEQNTVLSLNDILIEFCESPYANVKELARKVPASFSDIYHQYFVNVNEEVFDNDFFSFLDSLAENSFEVFANKSIDDLFTKSGNLEISELFNHFFDYLETDTMATKQLHYILQVMFQSVFSAGKSAIETKYLLISLLSPRYKVDYITLRDDLLLEYRHLGGDTKSAEIQDWGIRDNRLDYILLSSIDGIIKTDQTFYFDQTSSSLPFSNKTRGIPFKSIELSCKINHSFVKAFQKKRIIFTQESRMGSDFPYWEVYFDEQALMTASYSYADYLGTKASFYYQNALEDLYQSLVVMFPDLDRSEFMKSAEVKSGSDIWYEYPAKDKAILHPHHQFVLKDLYQKQGGEIVHGISHCGPNRTKSLGFLSYLLDVFAADLNFSAS